LKGDVNVVKTLPSELVSAPKAVKQFQSWSNIKYYQESIAPLWREYKVYAHPPTPPLVLLFYVLDLHWSKASEEEESIFSFVISNCETASLQHS
jgi:hypothetical protein